MQIILHLFRGDKNINEQTKPAIFRSDGIVSSSFGGGGDPLNIERKAYLRTVNEHLDHIKDFM
jgi:hypothetical protein